MSLVDFTYKETQQFMDLVPKSKRKDIGQFFTPPSIANYMGSLMKCNDEHISVLDAGAGSGILSASILEEVLNSKKVKSVYLCLYENNATVLPMLQSNIAHIKGIMDKQGVNLTYEIKNENFIIDNISLWRGEIESTSKYFDVIISNPPYKKISKSDKEAEYMPEIVFGQPNIYFLFMAMAAKMLKENGQLIFINPRSFSSGAYFQRFRQWFFNTVRLTNLHLFISREDVFNADSVLQETIILKAVKTSSVVEYVNITESESMDDFRKIQSFIVPYDTILDNKDDNCFLLIPTKQEDIRILNYVNSWKENLVSLGYKLKTGPVVDFRAIEYLKVDPEVNTVPLFWAYNFEKNRINFPVQDDKKPQYIINIGDSKKLLLMNKNYIFIKRFTSKEEKRRLQGVLYFSKDFQDYSYIGVENHLNYITKTDGDMSEEELYGLFVVINSSILDKYFRILNGSTQVNANEMNSIPFPSKGDILDLGKNGMKIDNLTTEVCDKLLDEKFNRKEILNRIEGVDKMGKHEDALQVLNELGLPKAQQNSRSALTLLSLLRLKEEQSWISASNNIIGIHEIMIFIAENYEVQYAENTRESIRRQTIHQFEQAGLVERNKDNPARPTNSGKTVYSITPEALTVLKSYGTANWDAMKNSYLSSKDTLVERYASKRSIHKIPIHIGDLTLEMSAGDHNDLQKAIIQEFASRFAIGSKLLYVGDTANKQLYVLDEELEALGIPVTKHDKLPDVVLYDSEKNWLFLCEAVTSHGPVSPKRVVELEEMLKDCRCGKIYVSCFPDKQTYKKFWDDIAWETEVWFSETPDHMIHFNGDRFMGPHK
jgi:adenine-specific DNA-methyltransferase